MVPVLIIIEIGTFKKLRKRLDWRSVFGTCIWYVKNVLRLITYLYSTILCSLAYLLDNNSHSTCDTFRHIVIRYKLINISLRFHLHVVFVKEINTAVGDDIMIIDQIIWVYIPVYCFYYHISFKTNDLIKQPLLAYVYLLFNCSMSLSITSNLNSTSSIYYSNVIIVSFTHFTYIYKWYKGVNCTYRPIWYLSGINVIPANVKFFLLYSVLRNEWNVVVPGCDKIIIHTSTNLQYPFHLSPWWDLLRFIYTSLSGGCCILAPKKGFPCRTTLILDKQCTLDPTQSALSNLINRSVFFRRRQAAPAAQGFISNRNNGKLT